MKLGARRRDAWIGVVLTSLTFLAYGPCLGGQLLWDDDGHVTRPDLQPLGGLWRIWFKLQATHQYYPVLHSAFWIEHRLWGDATVGYHALNVLLHATSACLLVALLRRLWGGTHDYAAWACGFVFALHPVCVESVAWITEQKNTLSGVFYFAAALAYLSFDERRTPGRYWLATLLFVLALLSKTVTATLPAALLVILWWRHGRLSLRRDFLPLAPWLMAGVGIGLGTAWVERRFAGAEGLPFDLSFLQRCLLASRAIWFYAAKVLWPANLIFIYPRWSLNPSEGWQYVPPAAGIAGLAAVWLLWRRTGWRGPLAGCLFFAGTLFPALGFFNVYPFRYSYVADHFQYLACLGLIVPAVTGAALGLERLPRSARRWAGALAVAALAALTVLTWRQSGIYRNNEILYRTTLERNPGCWMAHNNLGELLSKNRARLGEAIFHYKESLRLNPAHAEAENNLGVALAESGRRNEALGHYEAALRLNPDFAQARNNLANLLAQSGRTMEAIEQFEQALRLDPAVAETQNNLGNALLQAGRRREAMEHYEAALRLDPGYVEARNGLAAALFQSGRIQAAIEQFQAVLRIRPDDPIATENLRRIEAYLQTRR